MNHARRLVRSTSFLALVLAPGASANDTLLVSPTPPLRTGGAVVQAGDLDGDGVTDLAETNGSVVRWISGASGAVLGSATLPQGFAGYHTALLAAGDLDGDGAPDLVAGIEGVTAFSGATAQVLWSLTSPSQGFGHALARLDDRDGDGVAEILVGVTEMIVWGGGDVVNSGYGGDGRAEVRSGASGALLATITAPPGAGRGFGGSVAAIDDLDGDGRRDLVIAPLYQTGPTIPGPYGASGDVRVFGSSNLAELSAFTVPPSRSTRVTALGDLDGDGIGEIALAQIHERVRIFNPATGALVRTHLGQTAYERVGQAVEDLGDLDGDGVGDYAIGSAPLQLSPPTIASFDGGPGVVRAHSGATGNVLWTIAGTEANGAFGWSLASMGDLDGDQLADLAVGSPGVSRVEVVSSSIANSTPNAYCLGGLLSGAQRARLLHAGSTSVAADDLVLVATNALPGQSGLFAYSRSAAFTSFGAGWRCIGSPFFRLGPIVTADASGSASHALDLGAPPASAGPGSIAIGTTVHFQFLFRDLLPFHGGRNASSALAVTFTP